MSYPDDDSDPVGKEFERWLVNKLESTSSVTGGAIRSIPGLLVAAFTFFWRFMLFLGGERRRP